MIDSILLIVVIASLLILSLAAYHRDPSNKVHRYFAIALFWISFWVTVNYLEGEHLPSFLSTLFLKLDFASAVLGCYYIFSFCLNFPSFCSPFNLKEKYFFIPAIVLSVLSFTDLIIHDISSFQEGIQLQFKAGPLFVFYSLYLFGYFAVALYSLFTKRKRSSGIARNQIAYVLVGIILSMVIALTVNLVLSQIITLTVGLSRIGIYSILFFAGFTSYAILKHRLMNIDVFIKKSVTDILLFSGMGILTLIAVLVLEKNFYKMVNPPLVLNSLFVFLIILFSYFFRRLKPATEKKVEKMLFKDKYDYLESLAKLGQRATTCLDLDKLLDDVVNSLAGGLKLDDVAVYIFQEDTQEYYLAKDFNLANEKIDRLTLFDPCVAFLNGRGRIIVWDEERQCPEDVLTRVSGAKIAVTVPLVFEKKMVGIVQLSDKSSREIYSQEDLELLHALAERISSGLANAKEHGASDELYRVRSRHERITSLAELGAGLCHQLNNPLTPIKGFLQLVGKEGHKLEDLGVLKGEAEKAVDRIVKIIKEVEVFSETGLNIAHIQADVNAVLRKAVPMIVGAGLEPALTIDLDENLPTILGDERALLDIFVAIGTNGIEAMFERRRDKNANARDLLKSGIPPEVLVKMGILKDVRDAADIMAQEEEKRENKLTIRTRRGDPVGRPVGAGSKPAQYIRVEITDTGEGIKPEDLAKIFNPMHSTKSMHIGLSLAIAHRLVEAHGGYMEVKSKVGEGTSFFVNLPLAYNPSGKEIIQEKEAQRSGQRAWEGVAA